MSKRILFLTPQLPFPLYQGTAIRNFGLIDGLAKRGHRITLVSFVEANQPPVADTPLSDLCERVLTCPVPARSKVRRLADLALGRVDMARRLWSAEFLKVLRNLLDAESFDVIHFEGIEMASYLSHVADLVEQQPGTMLIYDAHNCEYALQRRIARQDRQQIRRLHAAVYSTIQAKRLERLEAAICRRVDHVFAVSEADAEQLADLKQGAPITVIPNGIRVDDYQGAEEIADVPHPALVFTGKMDFRPNVDAVLWFAQDILPLVREQVPGAHFVIVGQKPHKRLDLLRSRPAVTLTGFVESVEPFINAADVYVAPLRMGSGTRLKLLQAMAMRRAIVSTRLGAEGLDAEDGVHLRLADIAEAFAQAIVSLLADDERRQALGEQALAHVRAYYDWPVIIPTVEEAYRAFEGSSTSSDGR
jgi:sugar transferase (PEP-CTERM/EpsH1 system associated)